MKQTDGSHVEPSTNLEQLEPAHNAGAPVAWPSLGDLSASQQQIEDDSLLWLTYCQKLAQQRLPSVCFDSIPPDIWRFRVYGSKVVVMRTPQVEQQGSIILPDSSKKPNQVGWILTVGPSIHNTDEPNVKGREYPYSGYGDFSPLLAVGDLVLFNRHAGQALVSSLIDEGMVHRSKGEQFLLISIADVFGPLVNVQHSDWSAVQENIYVPTGEQTRILTT